MELDQFATDPVAFIRELTVSTSAGPRRFGDCMAAFQRVDFEHLAPSLIALANGDLPPVRRAWLERTKGASKDSDLACSLLWLLAFSPLPLRIQIGAFDADQADEIRLIVRNLLRLDGELNAMLAGLLQVKGESIVNPTTGASAEILTRDSKGSHGSRPELVILNEASHVQDREFAETLLDNADKMPRGMVVIATNAGFDPSWQLEWKRAAVASGRWYVSEYKQPAPWIAAADLAESERRNSRSRFLRLWHGVWASGQGDAIDGNLIDAACILPGPTFAPQPAFVYFGAADLGLRKDSSAIVVLGKSVGQYIEQPPKERPVRPLWARVCDELDLRDAETGERYVQRQDDFDQQVWQPGDETLHLAQVQVFRPAGSEALSLSQVERAIAELNRVFRFAAVYCDQWQAALLVERLRAANVPAIGIDPTGPALRQQAQVVLDLFTERRIKLYREPTLLADLGRLRVEEKSYGVRLSAARTSGGEGTAHADSASAFALACLAAHRATGNIVGPPYGGGPLLCWP